MALLEAMSEGMPIVASRVGGIPSTIADGVEGLTVEAGDQEGLLNALRRVLGDRTLRDALRTASHRRFARDYSVERMAEYYLEFYGCVLADRSEIASTDDLASG